MENELIDLLRNAASLFQARMQNQVASIGDGLTGFQARLLNVIGRHDGISQLALASFMDRDKAQITRAVKDMEGRGLILRVAHESDWRIKSLTLTAKGRDMHARLNAIRHDLAVEMFSPLNDEEKNMLRQSLKKITGSFEGQDTVCPGPSSLP